MEDLLYPKIIIKKFKAIKNLAEKNNYENIIKPINDILIYFENLYANDVIDNRENEVNIKESRVEIIAYYLSRFDHYDLFPSLNQNQAFDKIANTINVKKTTLRILRDRYDSKITKIKMKESPYLKIRKGINVPLSKKEKAIFEYYKNKKRTQILKDVIQIFKSYKRGIWTEP